MVLQVRSERLKRVERLTTLKTPVTATGSGNMCPQDAADEEHVTPGELDVVCPTAPAATALEIAVAQALWGLVAPWLVWFFCGEFSVNSGCLG